MPRRVAVAVLLSLILAVSINAQTGQSGKPVIAAVDNNQPILAPAADLTVLENKLGIGTATPGFKLDVVGQINGSGGLCIGGDCRTTWPTSGTSGPWTLSGSSAIYNGGNVGISNSSPAYRLDVAGQVNASGGLCIGGDCKTAWPVVTSQWTSSGSNLSFAGGAVGIGVGAPTYKLAVADEGGGTFGVSSDASTVTIGSRTNHNFAVVSNNASRMFIENTGNVGIGTTAPPTKFAVVDAGGSTFAVSGTASTVTAGARSNHNLSLVTNNANRIYVENTGNVGIGTTAPVRFLQVDRPSGNVQIGLYTAGSERAVLTGATDGKFHIDTGNNPRITVTAGGDVGIGTTSPTHKLHVVGNVKVDGNISALYQDVAEWVEAAAPLADGTVVILDVSRPNVVTEAVTAYDTRVAGAVSAQPGVVLGEAANNKELVAQSGRVRIKVDAPLARSRLAICWSPRLRPATP